MNRRRLSSLLPSTPKIESFTTEEITTILNAVNNTEYIVPVVLGLYAGMRESEILALRWSDISFDQNTISVTKSILRFSSEIDVPKSIRTIKMNPYLKAFLEKIQERQQKQKELACDSWQDNIVRNTINNEIETIRDFVNIHPKGDMLTKIDLKRLSTTIAAQGIEFKFRKLRNTYINLPVNDEMIQKHLEPILQTL